MSPHAGDSPQRAAGHLVIITGLPGSGKTTCAKGLASTIGAVRMCPDDWMMSSGIDLWDADTRYRIERFQLELSQVLLAAGSNVIIEWGVWTRSERNELREVARLLGASVELRYLRADPEELWRRIEARDMEGSWASRPIRREELNAWIESYEAPDAAELSTYDLPLAN